MTLRDGSLETWFVVSSLPSDDAAFKMQGGQLLLCRDWRAEDYEHAMEQHIDSFPEEAVICASLTEPHFYGSVLA